MNSLKVFALIAALTALFMGVGALVGGSQGMMIAFLVAVAKRMTIEANTNNASLQLLLIQKVKRLY